jgi:hypothetical protein
MSRVARSVWVVALTALWASPSAAQGLEFGAKGGVGITSVSNVSEITSTSDSDAARRFGPVFGGFAAAPLRGRLSIQAEALVSIRGARLDVDSNDDETLRLTYLDVPVLVKLTAPSGGDDKALYVIGGPYIGFNLQAKVREGDEDRDIADRVTGTDFGVMVGAGLQGRRWLVEGRYSAGLKNIATDSDDSVKARTIAVLAGIRF